MFLCLFSIYSDDLLIKKDFVNEIIICSVWLGGLCHLAEILKNQY